MNFLATLRVALNALRVNKMRSALTMLGIIIGVAAVIVMIAVGSGAQAKVEDQIRSLGSNLILVFSASATFTGARSTAGSLQTISEDDAYAIARELPEEIQTAAPVLRGSGQVVAGNANWSTTFYGVTPEYFEAREWQIAEGRALEQAEIHSAAKVALIGQTVAMSRFGDENQPARQRRCTASRTDASSTGSPRDRHTRSTSSARIGCTHCPVGLVV